ncbi:hypothetical protein [Streptomyces sp. NPDC012888]|uniref:hypothetical protein n=1 Tax=Streptomyces sp. NPDC012888 TaxID=3364855 RepID=UPI0036958974
MTRPRLQTTESAVVAIREVADEHRLTMTVTDDIGADRTSRRTSAAPFEVLDPDGSLPHEAFVELTGAPAVEVRLYPGDDALITVDHVEFHDVPRDEVPAFLRSVYGGRAHTKSRFFPPGVWLVVPLPGGTTYREPVTGLNPSPWLLRASRDA